MPSDQTISWFENLAEQEMQIDSGTRASYDVSATKTGVLSVETVAFLRALQSKFSFLIDLFNIRIQTSHLRIRIDRDSESFAFSIGRNSCLLSVGTPKAGFIHMSGVRQTRVEGQDKPVLLFAGTIEGIFGVFHDIEWHYLGSNVTPEQIARHYLTEFIQMSRTSH